MTENNLVLTEQQKLDFALQTIREDLGYLRETVTTLCSAMQDLVDKLALQGTPTRPTFNPSAKTTGTTQPTPTQQQTAAVTIKVYTTEDVISSFPIQIASKLDFSLRKQGTIVMVKPKEFLKEYFKDVAATIRAMGGQYISAGKESRFEVPLRSA